MEKEKKKNEMLMTMMQTSRDSNAAVQNTMLTALSTAVDKLSQFSSPKPAAINLDAEDANPTPILKRNPPPTPKRVRVSDGDTGHNPAISTNSTTPADDSSLIAVETDRYKDLLVTHGKKKNGAKRLDALDKWMQLEGIIYQGDRNEDDMILALAKARLRKFR